MRSGTGPSCWRFAARPMPGSPRCSWSPSSRSGSWRRGADQGRPRRSSTGQEMSFDTLARTRSTTRTTCTSGSLSSPSRGRCAWNSIRYRKCRCAHTCNWPRTWQATHERPGRGRVGGTNKAPALSAQTQWRAPGGAAQFTDTGLANADMHATTLVTARHDDMCIDTCAHTAHCTCMLVARACAPCWPPRAVRPKATPAWPRALFGIPQPQL